MADNIPEMVGEKRDKVDSIFLRTVVRKDVYERLKDFAQQYSTGQGNWDFGVAVQILLDYFESSKLSIQSEKIDMILSILSSKETQQETPPEEEMIEMLGGSKISKR
jgi:hypothetical protein